MPGDALRLAVELHGQPMLRHGMRDRALPAGIEELLLVTGGSRGRLSALAQPLRLPADEVLQAARFFVQELLFHADADAYRVLGVAADADDATIKRHYRALQHWLHPDRLANSPESIYSARVNRAWDQLRTAERRNAFDAAAEAEAKSGIPMSPSAEGAVRIQRWERVEQPPEVALRPQLIATAGLFVVCVGLLWLAVREQPVPSLPEPLDWAGQAVDDVGLLVSTRELESQQELNPMTRPEPVFDVTMVPEGLANGAADDRAILAPLPSLRTEFTAARNSSSRSDVATEPDVTSLPGVVPSSATPRIATVAAEDALGPKPEPRIRKTAPKAPPAITPKNPAEPEPARAAATEPQDGTAKQLVARHQAAQAQAQRLLTFLTGRNVQTPPIWRNVKALDSAQAIRGELASGTRLRRAKVNVDQSHWTMGDSTAALVVPIHPANRNGATRSMRASLVWQDGGWWVDSVTLGPER